MKNDIQSREDLLRLVTLFYEKLLADPSIAYLFTDVARIDLAHHLPVLVDFWEGILFQTGGYQRNTLQPHIDLNLRSPLTEEHFKTWLRYFSESVDELFVGEKAFQAKERALSITTVMKIKLARSRTT
jgi:hemoglobin